MTYIAPKRCPICREMFTPIPRSDGTPQVTCGTKICKHTYQGQRLRGHRPTKAIEARHAQRRQRAQQALGATFGDLSERELALYQVAWLEGYQVGYNVAYHRTRQKRTAA